MVQEVLAWRCGRQAFVEKAAEFSQSSSSDLQQEKKKNQKTKPKNCRGIQLARHDKKKRYGYHRYQDALRETKQLHRCDPYHVT